MHCLRRDIPLSAQIQSIVFRSYLTLPSSPSTGQHVKSLFTFALHCFWVQEKECVDWLVCILFSRQCSMFELHLCMLTLKVITEYFTHFDREQMMFWNQLHLGRLSQQLQELT